MRESVVAPVAEGSLAAAVAAAGAAEVAEAVLAQSAWIAGDGGGGDGGCRHRLRKEAGGQPGWRMGVSAS